MKFQFIQRQAQGKRIQAVTLWAKKDVKSALEKAAKKCNLTKSQLALNLVEHCLKEGGYLK